MKIHWLSVIRFCLVLILFIAFILIFKQNYLVFLLIPYGLLPIISIPLFLRNAQKVEFSTGSLSDYAECGGDIKFFLGFDNHTILPFLKCTFNFTVSNVYYQNKGENKLNFSVSTKKHDKIVVSVKTSRNGMVIFKGKKLLMTDWTGFVSLNREIPADVTVPVFPESGNIIDVPEIPYSEGYEEYAETDSKGNVSSDIKEIREYRPGDRLARIHWKASAKLDELCVKEMERTSTMSVVLLPELEKSKIDDTIRMLDMAATRLMENGERFEICLFNVKTFEFDYHVVDNRNSLLDCFRDMYFLPVYDNDGAAMEAYYASVQKSSFLLKIWGDEIALYEDGIRL